MKAKTMTNRILGALLALTCIFALIPVSSVRVHAVDEGSTGGVEIATAKLPEATVGEAYDVTLSATPKDSTFFWYITGLPAGLTADFSGNITGTPTAAGTYTVSVTVGSTGGGSAAKEMTLTVNAATAETFTINATSSDDYRGGVSGGGTYDEGATVTLTAEANSDITFFAYWLDSSVTLADSPTAAELEAAIVSYDSTYTFTATKDMSLTAVFGYTASFSVSRMAYASADDIFSEDEGGGAYIDDHMIEIGKQSVTVSPSDHAAYVTVGGVLYERHSMFTQSYDEATGRVVYETLGSFTIPAAPLYDSAEYWTYVDTYEKQITVAYVPHTHSYSVATCKALATCSCGATTGSVDSTNHAGGTEVRGQKDATEFEEGYTGDTYCLGCGTKLADGEATSATHGHSYAAATCTTPATCSCGATMGDVDSTNHAGGTEVRGQKDATEFEEGYTGDTYCLGCDTKLADGEATSVTYTHSYAAATCTAPATCACGATTGGVDSTNHKGGVEYKNKRDYIGDGVNDTEAEFGYTGDLHCLGCGAELEKGVYFAKATSFCPTNCSDGGWGWSFSGGGHEFDCNHSYEGTWGDYFHKEYGSDHFTIYEPEYDETNSVTKWINLDDAIYVKEDYKSDYASLYPWHNNPSHHWLVCVCGYIGFYEQHNITGGEFNDKTHQRICADCGTLEAAHELELVSPNGHALKCACGYTTESEHEWKQLYPNGDGHELYCAVCGERKYDHSYTAFKPSEANPETYHVLHCSVCGEMSDPVQVDGHTYEVKKDKDGHWNLCTDCGYTTEKRLHRITVSQSDWKFLYHFKKCTDCGYEETENCDFDDHYKYVGNVDGHWKTCAACGKPHSGMKLEAHDAGEALDGTCLECGVDFKHPHSYVYRSLGSHGHSGECACGAGVTGYHVDGDGNGKCDDCGEEVALTGRSSSVVYVPAPGQSSKEITREYYEPTADDYAAILKGKITGGTVSYAADTNLGDMTLEGGKTYNFQVLFSENIHIDDPYGTLTIWCSDLSVLSGNMRLLAAHILADEAVQYSPVTYDRVTAVAYATMMITETSPFILLAITEVGAEDEHTEHTGGTATCKDRAVCETCGESYGELAAHTDADDNSKCDVCDRLMGSSSVVDPEPIDNDGLEAWAIVLIVIGAVALFGGGFAVYWFVIRKKNRS